MKLLPTIRQRTSQLLSLYLPAFLMAGLALGSWWLVRQNPEPVAVQSEPARILDYEMRDFSTVTYSANGNAANALAGSSLQHFSTGEMHIAQPRILLQHENGGQTQASAKQAISNDDASDVTLQGQALITRTGSAAAPEMQLRGEQFHITQKGQLIVAPQAVDIERGKLRFTAGGMQYNADSGVLELTRGVRGQIQP